MNYRKVLFAALVASLTLTAAGCGNEDIVSTADISSQLELVESTKPTDEGETTTQLSTSKSTGTLTTRSNTVTTTDTKTTAAGRKVAASGGNRNTQKSQNGTSQNVNKNTNKNTSQNTNNNQNNGGQSQQNTTNSSGGNSVQPENDPKPQEPTTPPQQPTEQQDFSKFQSYQDWASETGYSSGALIPGGSDGINQDYYHTLPGSQNYNSGNIVVGDSRCCQMGIYEQRTSSSDFAAFGVWGGHFVSISPPVLSSQLLADVEECFKAQIDACGKCELYFFVTVNDYDFISNDNAGNISAAIQAAETLASLSYDNGNGIQHPNVHVIGFDGCWTTSDLWGIPQEDFNRYISDYNEAVRNAVAASPLLSTNAESYTTVPLLAGGKAGFIDDGLHYSDDTIRAIASYIAS